MGFEVLKFLNVLWLLVCSKKKAVVYGHISLYTYIHIYMYEIKFEDLNV